jgi:VanZ family protein
MGSPRCYAGSENADAEPQDGERVSVPLRIRRPWLLVSAMYVALIFFVSSRPYLYTPGPQFHYKDKVAHCVEYALLAWFMGRALRPARALPPAVEVLCFVAVGAGIAGLDEMFQGTVEGRVTDVTDWMADVLGLLIGATIAVRSARKSRTPA